jgi:hypothetical protein
LGVRGGFGFSVIVCHLSWIIRAPCRSVIRADGQRVTAAQHVATATSKSSTPATCSTMLSPVSSQMSTRKAKCVLVFIGAKSDWTGPRPDLFIPMLLRRVAFPDFCEPCLPTKTDRLPPSGSQWLHEIKHDGFRVTGSAFYRLALACGEARPS